MNIPILYEDDNLLIINKPSGLVVHSDGKTNEESVADWVLENYPEMKEVGEPWQSQTGEMIYRPGIVHRLDRETSGVLVIAKTQESFLYLKNLFQTRDILKIYHAFVYGEVKEDEMTVDRPITRSKKDFRLWSAQRGGRGVAREAVTDFVTLKRTKEASFLEVRPQSGRTHQIRVHLKAVNHPVVADKLYAPKREPILGFNRLALHASRIEFKDASGKEIKVEASFPEDFEQALALLG